MKHLNPTSATSSLENVNFKVNVDDMDKMSPPVTAGMMALKEKNEEIKLN